MSDEQVSGDEKYFTANSSLNSDKYYTARPLTLESESNVPAPDFNTENYYTPQPLTIDSNTNVTSLDDLAPAPNSLVRDSESYYDGFGQLFKQPKSNSTDGSEYYDGFNQLFQGAEDSGIGNLLRNKPLPPVPTNSLVEKVSDIVPTVLENLPQNLPATVISPQIKDNSSMTSTIFPQLNFRPIVDSGIQTDEPVKGNVNQTIEMPKKESSEIPTQTDNLPQEVPMNNEYVTGNENITTPYYFPSQQNPIRSIYDSPSYAQYYQPLTENLSPYIQPPPYTPMMMSQQLISPTILPNGNILSSSQLSNKVRQQSIDSLSDRLSGKNKNPSKISSPRSFSSSQSLFSPNLDNFGFVSKNTFKNGEPEFVLANLEKSKSFTVKPTVIQKSSNDQSNSSSTSAKVATNVDSVNKDGEGENVSKTTMIDDKFMKSLEARTLDAKLQILKLLSAL